MTVLRPGQKSRENNRLVTWACALAVAIVAVVLRIPYCYESFWIDELHTAWAVWAEFDKVTDRAAAGNQTPLYFHGVWLWKAVFGPSEFALRMSSVLATSAAAALSVLGLKHVTGRLSAGLIAGAILTVESNSMFFGTELRPYSVVMLLSVIATWTTALAIQAKDSKLAARYRLAVVVTVCLATLVHPTSVIVLGLLLAIVLGASGKGFTRIDAVSIIVAIVTLLLLMDSSLGETWARRGQWKAIARATSVSQFFLFWPWISTVVLPLAFGLIAIRKLSWRDTAVASVPMLVAILATGLIFIASYSGWIYLWFWRYVIAALPLLAWSAGAWATMLFPFRSKYLDVVLLLVIASVMIGTLTWRQGRFEKVKTTNGESKWTIRPYAQRNEGWRSAVAFVNQRKQPGDEVWLDSALIEASVLQTKSGAKIETDTPDFYRYLLYPTSGPYAVAATPVSLHRARPTPGVWLVSRSRFQTLRHWIGDKSNTTKRFVGRNGRIHVVRINGPGED